MNMGDCRLALDNLNDQSAISGTLMVGSDSIDISGAQMVSKEDHWEARISTVNPAPQNPRLPVTVALYLDADGRSANNAPAGMRLGADEVYGMVLGKDGWLLTREMYFPDRSAFETQKTGATFSFANDAYIMNIPFAELPKGAKAYWRAGIAVKDGDRLSADFVPDSGYACAPSLVVPNPWLVKARALYDSDAFREGALFAIVIVTLAVIFWYKRKRKKHQP